tara:strand:+ start:30286 stop:30858 length:573 start_codon:yes stop_codon:yes gene_type:complete
MIMTGLMFSCSGFSKYPKSPVPVGYDSEFLYWCEQDGVWPVYANKPDCPVISRGKWDHLPIIVSAEDQFVTETLEAIEAFNGQVGFELFKFKYATLKADVNVIDGGRRLFLYAVAKHLTLPSGAKRGAVIMYNGLGAFDRADVVMHELGHIVGLRHDRDNPLSLMFHTDGSIAMSLERQDIFALRMMYNK